MMVALLPYAYAVGERSSRGIERRCREDVAFRVICANQVPDHATIARFRVRHEEALAVSSVRCSASAPRPVSLGRRCRRGRLKLAADASGDANRGHEQIATEILAEAGRIDAAEDELHGDRRGDELPEELGRAAAARSGSARRRRRQKEEREAEPEPVPRERAERLELCRRRLEDEHRTGRANRDYERGRGLSGRVAAAPRSRHATCSTRGEGQHHRPRLAHR